MNSETIKYSRFEANVFFFDTTIDENSMGVVVSLNRNVREKERERERERVSRTNKELSYVFLCV